MTSARSTPLRPAHSRERLVVQQRTVDGETALETQTQLQSSTRNWWTRLQYCLDPRVWLRAILMLDDTPHAIALGTAIGLFVGMTPTVGIQMVIVLAVAFLTRRLFHFNRVAALIAVYISNPLTTVPIYWFNYRLGAVFMEETVSKAEFAALFRYRDFSGWWESVKAITVTVGLPLLVGSLVMGSIFALASYPLMRRSLEQVQHRRRERHSKTRLAERSGRSES
jgi:uncharacterized protein (DUF2062 family)